jgi:phage pi2 protein 07
MKNLILIFVILVSFSVFAQDNNESSKTKTEAETNAWMNKIASDSEMRVKMLDMMMDKTSGNKEEMMKLVNSILSNPEMNKMISTQNNAKTGRKGTSLEPKSRGMMNDTLKVKEISGTKPVYRK